MVSQLPTFRFFPLGFLISFSRDRFFVNFPTDAVEDLATERARLTWSLEGFSVGARGASATINYCII